MTASIPPLVAGLVVLSGPGTAPQSVAASTLVTVSTASGLGDARLTGVRVVRGEATMLVTTTWRAGEAHVVASSSDGFASWQVHEVDAGTAAARVRPVPRGVAEGAACAPAAGVSFCLAPGADRARVVGATGAHDSAPVPTVGDDATPAGSLEPGTVAVLGSAAAGRSTDGGHTWTTLPPVTVADPVVLPDGRLLGRDGESLVVSDEDWNDFTTLDVADPALADVAVAQVQASGGSDPLLVVRTVDGRVLVSPDAAVFTEIPTR